ncbi:hypothetical protein, partial [Cytobacillus oceanisediminis]|uniref:hypothetical protein n=1 Tax=Cytobacillus oceanisediminis TaxID=665099 RepID=UPI0011AAA10F
MRGFMQVVEGERKVSEEENVLIRICVEELEGRERMMNNLVGVGKGNRGWMDEMEVSGILKERSVLMRFYFYLFNTE